MEESNKINHILFIVGSTASGKTKLSLGLADKFKNIEIINADALQLYRGANIMVAKASSEEQLITKHHMLDILDLDSKSFTRKDYCDMTLKIIQDIWDREKIPLIVGGTNYYIESLLFNDYDIQENLNFDQVNEMYEKINNSLDEDPQNEIEITREDPIFRDWISLSSEKKHELLRRIDPLIAEKVHKNDQKRLENYIKVFIDENIIPSKKIMAVNQQRKLRFENAIILWVKDKSKQNLHQRMEKRIEEMLDGNGVKEVLEVYLRLDNGQDFDFTKGILQSIGYKEFHKFYSIIKDLSKKNNTSPNTILEQYLSDEKHSEDINPIFLECKKNLNLATQHYARRQIQWIKNRLCENSFLKSRLFEFEFEDSSKFSEQVTNPSHERIKDYLSGKLNFKIEQKVDSENFYMSWKRIYCEDCEIYLNGEKEYKVHVESKKHQKRKEKRKQFLRNMEIKMQRDLEKKKLEE